ncbi:winged helix DNA-binding protein [Streptomyces sp. YC504]|uniref:Winged helix DNA-binding protein n=1 Tax=Streptomyces mesophilus TaxID=1775132 RepID=A0A6G4XLM9_9ACTN|nr:MarR family transcriptional regulator [Streptomyces mesophilus]NGO77531.1 winged helix DNA-binding protein [Streptomyces mesophilus]
MRELEAVAQELRSAMGHLMRMMSASEPSRKAGRELTPSQVSLLRRVQRGGPSTPADLARAELIRPQSVLATLKPLLAARLVERVPHPTDGRQVLISLTDVGIARLDERDSARSDVVARLFAEHLTPAEQRTMAAAASLLRRISQL